jgi:MFS family permease
MRKRFVVLSFLGSLSVITYLDRVCIAVAGPRMQRDLHLGPEQWGWVMGVFVLAYGLFEIPTGALGDRTGPRRVLTRIVVWWSGFTMLTGAMTGFAALAVTRFLFGAGEAGAFPTMSAVVARWFPPGERARAQGCIWGASRIGGAISPWLVVPLIAAFGWRSIFFIFGWLGLGWAWLWQRWIRDEPARQPGITAAELAEIGPAASAARGEPVPWGRLLRSGQLWLLMAMFSCYVWGSIFYLTWFPTYLVQGRGLTEKEMGLCAALPFLLGCAGNLLGGYLSDRLSRRYGLAIGRRTVGSASLVLSALCLGGTALTQGKASGVILLSLGFGVMDCMLPTAWALCLDLGRQFSGVVSAAMNTAGQAGGFVCSVLFGYLVKAWGRYDLPLLVIAGMVLLSAGLFWQIDPTRPILADEPAPLPCA